MPGRTSLSFAPVYAGSGEPITATATFVLVPGVLTDENGEVTMNRVFASAQPVRGQARKSTDVPYFKEAALTGAVDPETGLTVTVVMISDA